MEFPTQEMTQVSTWEDEIEMGAVISYDGSTTGRERYGLSPLTFALLGLTVWMNWHDLIVAQMWD